MSRRCRSDRGYHISKPQRVVSADCGRVKGKPDTFLRRVVAAGRAVETARVEVDGDGKFERDFAIRENDAVLVTPRR